MVHTTYENGVDSEIRDESKKLFEMIDDISKNCFTVILLGSYSTEFGS